MRTVWSDASREQFLSRLAETANVAESARSVGMSRSSAYAERRRNGDFARAWQHALEIALDELEMTVLERALCGVEKQVFYAGEACGTVRHYSDSLAMFILRARRPHIYGKASITAETSQDQDARAMIEARLARLIQEKDTPEDL